MVYILFYAPLTTSRRRKQAERIARCERTLVYDQSHLEFEDPSRYYELRGQRQQSTEEGGSSASLWSRLRGRNRSQESRDSPIATGPLNLLRDLDAINATLVDTTDGSGNSVPGKCSQDQLQLIPLVLYIEMDEKEDRVPNLKARASLTSPKTGGKTGDLEEGNINMKQKAGRLVDPLAMLGIQPLRDIDLFNQFNPLDFNSTWLDDVEEEAEVKKSLEASQNKNLDQNTIQQESNLKNSVKISRSERSRLRSIGLSRKGKGKSRSQISETSDSILLNGVPTNNASIEAPSTGFRLRLRPKPVNQDYPLLEVPLNQATCTICLLDFESVDQSLLKIEDSRVGKGKEKTKKRKPKDEEKGSKSSLEPLRLLPCRHAFHVSIPYLCAVLLWKENLNLEKGDSFYFRGLLELAFSQTFLSFSSFSPIISTAILYR